MSRYALLEKTYIPSWELPHSLPKVLPTMYDLPYENLEADGLPDEFHSYQPQLLRETFCPPGHSTEKRYSASDLYLYYDPDHPKWYKRPDWFAVVGVSPYGPKHDLRYSYVVWEEKVPPFVVVELLSESTENEDLGKTQRKSKKPPTKWEVYEKILKVPYYVIFSRDLTQFRAFELKKENYSELRLPEQRLWLPEIQLGLGLWFGTYDNITHYWLRWYDNIDWIPTKLEQLTAEKRRAEEKTKQVQFERQQKEQALQEVAQERQQKEQALQEAALQRQRAEQLTQLLREQGIDPDKLDH